MFICPRCGGELSGADVVDLGLRLPDYGESASEYCDAELVDNLIHMECAGVQRAS